MRFRWAARKAVRRLVAKGALRLAERSRAGHVVKVRLPEEIRSVGAGKIAACAAVRVPSVVNGGDLEMAISWKRGRCARRSTRARAGRAFTACAG